MRSPALGLLLVLLALAAPSAAAESSDDGPLPVCLTVGTDFPFVVNGCCIYTNPHPPFIEIRPC